MKRLIKYKDGSERFVNSKEEVVKEIKDNYGEIRSFEEATLEVTKLLNYLNERSDMGQWNFDDSEEIGNRFFYTEDKESKYNLDEAVVISKNFGFIKWLIDTFKINWNKCDDDLEKINYFGDKSPACDSILPEVNEGRRLAERFLKSYDYKRLIMLLAIQDDPIKYLVGILR